MIEINSSQRVAEFSAIVDAAVEECGEFGYFPGYFVRMLEEKGAFMTAKQLVASGEIQSGLQRLAKEGRLELSIESIMCRFSYLFTAEEIEAAKWRIEKAKSGRLK